MSLRNVLVWATIGTTLCIGVNVEAASLRVCADPNNLPFSNQAQEGLENRLAQWIAEDMSASVEYTWWAQRRGFLRNTLQAGRCDVVMGLPVGVEGVLMTRPYYRSCYALVYRSNGTPAINTLDDPVLRQMRIGVHVVGEHNPPPALALASRGIIHNVSGYSIYGDYRRPNPPARLVEAVASGDIDVAIAWGPIAGYFGNRQGKPLIVQPLSDEDQRSSQPMGFSIALGVRPSDLALRERLDELLTTYRPRIATLLSEYKVPNCADGPQRSERALAQVH